MIKNTALVIAALLFVPAIAHAEFATPRDTGDVRPVATKRTKIERVPSRVALVNTPRLTVDEVLARVNGVYMSGKVMLAFRVTAEGRVQSQLGMTSKFDDCLTKMMRSWKFSAPSSEAESSFRISLVLMQ
jgi:hypothetical protein